jgi:hypothetical protein
MYPVYSADKRCAASSLNVPGPLCCRAASRPSCRRRARPLRWRTVRPCCGIRCAHHHSYVIREASAARQYYADRGYQGARRLHWRPALVVPSITSVMSLGPHVEAHHPCTCPPLSYKRGGTQHYKAQTHLDAAQAHKFIQALKLNTSHSGVGYYALAARTTLNPSVFLCSFIAYQTSKTLRPLLILGFRAGAFRHPARDFLSDNPEDDKGGY